jgi:hypothetical protein
MRVQRLAEGDARSIRSSRGKQNCRPAIRGELHLGFLGCRDGQASAGLVGLELYGSVGLLRLLAAAGLRGQGMGKRLVGARKRSRWDKVSGTSIFSPRLLLISSRQAAIPDLDRAEAPRPSRVPRKFVALRPASAAFMVKHIAARPE